MRSFKFRIWDKQSKSWANNDGSLHCYSNWSLDIFSGKLIDYVGAICDDQDDFFTAQPAPDHYWEKTSIVADERYKLLQFTGLRDRNDVEVYEGDLVLHTHSGDIGKIYFVAGTFMIDDKGPLCEFVYSTTPDILENYIVIGNIYENPDLLKE